MVFPAAQDGLKQTEVGRAWLGNDLHGMAMASAWAMPLVKVMLLRSHVYVISVRH